MAMRVSRALRRRIISYFNIRGNVKFHWHEVMEKRMKLVSPEMHVPPAQVSIPSYKFELADFVFLFLSFFVFFF